MRRLILNFHLFTALFAGAFIVLQGITGSILAFEPELDRAFHPHLAYVTPERQNLSLTEIGNAVSRQLGTEPVVAYVLSMSPNVSLQVLLPSGVAYVNQYTGKVLGIRARGQTILGEVRALHVRLTGGAIGREIIRWSAVCALFSALSGLYLWWPLKRLRILTSAGPRRFWFDLHNGVGICAFFPLILLAGSGVVLGFEDQAASLIYKLTQSGPTKISRAARQPAAAASFIDPDTALAIARARMPGAVPNRLQMPQYGGLYRVEFVDPQDRITGTRNTVALDPFNGSIVSLSRSADWSRGDRLVAANEALHTGNIIGLPGRIVACLVSTMIVIQGLSGAFIWFHRNRVSQPLLVR